VTSSPVPPFPGSHQLASTFGGVTTAHDAGRPPRRSGAARVIVAVLGVIVLGTICAGVQWGANVGYDEALIAFDDAVDDTASSQADLVDALATLTATTDAAAVVIDADSGALMDPAAKESLAAAIADAEEAESEGSTSAEESLPQSGEKPYWAWELFGEIAELNADRDDVGQMLDEYETAGDRAVETADAVQETGTAAVLSAADAAGGFEAAHISARNLDILALRDAAERVSAASALDETAADAYVYLESSAAAMLTSEKAEIAEKQGPLHDARLEVEAFARDLAPGVLLDFDWSPLVNGYGEADSMGGYATWWYSDPGYATIELSNSVAEYWPGERSRALVAHEVGHAISVKCEGMYDDSSQENIEAWATAWAISMGFTDTANGTSAYGPPPQSLIDAAAGCR